MNVGSPHSVDWIDETAAVLNVGFGGQELGEAVVDMLIGELEPSGRAPTTIGARYEHFAAFTNYPGENGVVQYGEGVYCGHRWHDSIGIEPAVAFGSGLGYTTFEITEVPATADFVDGVSINVTVTNTGERRGSEVVQAYVEPPSGPVPRPVRELKAFRKVTLDPGESATVTLEFDARAFASFDAGDPVHAELAANSLVPQAGAVATARSQVGTSSRATMSSMSVGHRVSSPGPVSSPLLTSATSACDPQPRLWTRLLTFGPSPKALLRLLATATGQRLRSPASTRLGVSGNESNQTPVASCTAATSAGA